MNDRDLDLERRRFLRLAVAAPIVFAAGAKLTWPADAAPTRPKDSPPARILAPTPECGDDDEPTPSLTAGPFYKPRSPLRASLIEPGVSGSRIVIAGRVFARDCRPVAGALLDFWQADDEGEYDNAGFRLRGHQFADREGRWRLVTVVPGLYPGRTRHFHVRVQAPNRPALTTQLFLPDEPRNRRDFLFDPELLLAVRNQEGAKEGRFHFVLPVD
jgi:protocatechuate 3,4-dioxygenase beta subunit